MKFLKWLGFDPEKHSVRTEILAGLTTFLTMAYILAVNPNVFDALGGEMSKANGAVFTATALAAIIGTLAMSFIAKKPPSRHYETARDAPFGASLSLWLCMSWCLSVPARSVWPS